MKKNVKSRKKLEQALEKHEGNVYAPYVDAVGKTTIGRGVNLDAPGADQLLEKAGLKDREPTSFSPSEVDKLNQLALDEKLRLFKEIENKFSRPLSEQEKNTMLGLFYQNRNLVGPKLVEAMNKGDTAEAAKEVLLRSNKSGIPGIQYRRIKEAESLIGPERMPELVQSLAPEEQQLVKDRLNQIDNPNTKQEAVDYFDRYLKERAGKK